MKVFVVIRKEITNDPVESVKMKWIKTTTGNEKYPMNLSIFDSQTG